MSRQRRKSAKILVTQLSDTFQYFQMRHLGFIPQLFIYFSKKKKKLLFPKKEKKLTQKVRKYIKTISPIKIKGLMEVDEIHPSFTYNYFKTFK